MPDRPSGIFCAVRCFCFFSLLCRRIAKGAFDIHLSLCLLSVFPTSLSCFPLLCFKFRVLFFCGCCNIAKRFSKMFRCFNLQIIIKEALSCTVVIVRRSGAGVLQKVLLILIGCCVYCLFSPTSLLCFPLLCFKFCVLFFYGCCNMAKCFVNLFVKVRVCTDSCKNNFVLFRPVYR